MNNSILLLLSFCATIFTSTSSQNHFLFTNAVFNPVIQPIISFCVGNNLACAVFDSYKMKCFGPLIYIGSSTTYGMTPSTVGDNVPYFNPGTNHTIVQVVCTSTSLCVLLNDSRIKCAGYNNIGQVGIGSTTNIIGESTGYAGDTLPVVNLGNGINVTRIIGGGSYICVITSDIKVKCFGYNGQGQLGLGSAVTKGRYPSDMGENLPFLDFGTGVEVASIHSGPSALHSCAILSKPVANAQRLKCWGLNDYSQLGYGDTNNRGDGINEMGDSLLLVDFGAESKVVNLALGEQHTCVLLVNNIVKCFGGGYFGQLGSGSANDIVSTGSSLPSVPIDSGKTVIFVSAGQYHTCIVYENMLIMKCFGYNNAGQLGQGDTDMRGDLTSTKIPNIPAIQLGTGSLKIQSIHSGDSFNCVVFVDSSVKCFGNNLGTLGIGSTDAIGDGPNEMGNNLQFAEFFSPTQSPTLPTSSPSKSPTTPTISPTRSPSLSPSKSPSRSPSAAPSKDPTDTPTLVPTQSPSLKPTKNPSLSPSTVPSKLPTTTPTTICNYMSAKLCKYDPNCMWVKINEVNQCVVYNCNGLNKGRCGKERSRCKWNKKRKSCDFKQQPK